MSPRLIAAMKRTGATAAHDAMRAAVEKVTATIMAEMRARKYCIMEVLSEMRVNLTKWDKCLCNKIAGVLTKEEGDAKLKQLKSEAKKKKTKKTRGRQKGTNDNEDKEELPYVPTWEDSSLLDIIDSLRGNRQAYRWFYDNVLAHTKNKKAWTNTVKTGKAKATELATVSDEALAILILENYWTVWAYKNRVARAEKDNEELDEDDEMPLPIYTKPGSQRESWGNRGMERFNEIYDDVVEDRMSVEGKEFDRWYTELQKEAYEKSEGGKKKKAPTKDKAEVKVKARNNLIVLSSNHDTGDTQEGTGKEDDEQNQDSDEEDSSTS